MRSVGFTYWPSDEGAVTKGDSNYESKKFPALSEEWVDKNEITESEKLAKLEDKV